jgi:hypothetical protein
MASYVMTDEIKKRISEATKKAMSNTELRLSLSQKKKEYYTKSGSLEKCSAIQKKRFTDPEQRRLNSERGKIYSHLKVGHTEPTKGKTFVEIYGEDRAKEIYYKVSIATKQTRIAKMKQKWQDPDFANRVSVGVQQSWEGNDERKKKTSETLRVVNIRLHQDPNSIFNSIEYRKKCGEVSRAKWKNPEYVQKLMKSVHAKPNKKELILLGILNGNFPNEFDYNGDARHGVVIDGKVPDYINIKGRKQVIELFGDWWHGKRRTGKEPSESEAKLKATYSKHGYDCLIIWEREIKDKEALIQKLEGYTCS